MKLYGKKAVKLIPEEWVLGRGTQTYTSNDSICIHHPDGHVEHKNFSEISSKAIVYIANIGQVVIVNGEAYEVMPGFLRQVPLKRIEESDVN